MSTLLLLAVVLAVLVVCGVAAAVTLGVVVTRRAVRAASVTSRRVGRARSTVRAALPGPAQAVHAQRARVHRELAGALDAFEAGRRDHRPVEVFAPHAAVLARIGSRLDVDLAVVAAEPDDRVRAAWLAELLPRVDTLAGACTQLRRGVLLAGDTDADAALAQAAHDLADRVEYLVARTGAYRDLTAERPR